MGNFKGKSYFVGVRLKPDGEKLINEIVETIEEAGSSAKPSTVMAALMDRLAAPDMRAIVIEWLSRDVYFYNNGGYDIKIVERKP